MSWCNLDLIFDFVKESLTSKCFPVYISETVRCRKFIFGRDIGWGCRYGVILISPLSLP